MAIRYRAEIDGLRAIAVLPVILFHAGHAAFAGGYVGVDVFFVISGFLITSILLREHDLSVTSIAVFYERRARRILPALFAVVAATLPFAWAWMMPHQLEAFARSLIAVPLFVPNFLFWRETSYFAPASELKPLLHTWSLGVEEQFYLIFPLVLPLLLRCRRLTTPVLALGLVASFVLCEWAAVAQPNANFYLLPTRAWELLIGTLVAVWSHGRTQEGPAAASDTLAAVGLLMVVVATFSFDDATPYPSRWTLLPTIGTAFVILGTAGQGYTARLLSMRPLVGIGRLSYSIYLWHFPVLAFARLRAPAPLTNEQALLCVPLIVLLATLSYFVIERPVRKMRMHRDRVFLSAALASSMCVIAGFALAATDGAPGRLSSLQRARYERVRRATNDSLIDDGACRFNTESLDQSARARFVSCATNHGRGLVILGDSHAGDLFNAVVLTSRRPFVVGISRGFCRVHEPRPGCHFEAAASFLAANAKWVDAVLFTQKGSYLLTGYRRLPVLKTPIEVAALYVHSLRTAVPVVWMGPHAEPAVDLRNLNILFREIVGADSTMERKALVQVDSQMAATAKGKKIPYVSTLRTVDYRFARDFISNGEYTYSDMDHWSPAGERVFGERLRRDPTLIGLLSVRQINKDP
jgi:peptidoglycan/LPS O-acetylase OafA/YrhL